MWIHEALVDAPRGAWRGIVASWTRTTFLAMAAVGAGATVDTVLNRGDWALAAILTAFAALLGAIAAGVAEAVQGRIQADEELRWRERVLRRALLGRPSRSPVSAPGQDAVAHGAAAPTHHGGARPAAGKPGSAKGGVAKPGAAKGGHPGGTPGSGHGPGRGHGRGATGDGALVDAATTAVEKTANYRAGFLGPTLASFTAPLLVLIVWAIFVDVLSALILVAFVALVPVVIVVVGKWLRKPNHEYRRKETAAANQYLEMLEGIGTMKVLGAAPAARDRFAESARAAMRELGTLLGRNQLMIIVNDGVFGLLMSGAAIVLVLAGLAAGSLTAGEAFAGVLLTVLLNEPIDRVGRTFYVGLAGRARRDQLEALTAGIEQTDSVKADSAKGGTAKTDSAAAETATADAAAAPPTPAVPLELRSVSVTIRGTTILHNVNLTIPAGQRVALVGPSGAGKTTLMRVLAGLAAAGADTVIDGAVLVDGEPANPAQLRGLVSVVGQQPGILSTTIADNLRLVAPDASDDALLAALDRAHLRAEVEAMPERLDTSVGDRGTFLSGGQRRRLAIARTFLRPRPVLLLDEPTADLDRTTESLVRESLAEVAQGRTVIQIAHRLDTTLDADLVAVMTDGRVVATGTPAELREAGGYYATALGEERAR